MFEDCTLCSQRSAPAVAGPIPCANSLLCTLDTHWRISHWRISSKALPRLPWRPPKPLNCPPVGSHSGASPPGPDTPAPQRPSGAASQRRTCARLRAHLGGALHNGGGGFDLSQVSGGVASPTWTSRAFLTRSLPFACTRRTATAQQLQYVAARDTGRRGTGIGWGPAVKSLQGKPVND